MMPDPAWCAGDLFLESDDAHLVFYWTIGWLSRWSIAAMIGIGSGSILPWVVQARITTHLLHELKRRGGNLALCTACAAGGLGAAMVLEAE